MAQIKVLDLYDSNSLSELSYENAQKVNGGGVGAIGGFGISLYRNSSRRFSYRNLRAAAETGFRLSRFTTPLGAGIGSVLGGNTVIGAGIGASLSS